MEPHAEQTIERARASGGTVALLVMDLDGFKEVNDTLGHDAGDVHLEKGARRLDEGTRSEDHVARLGGDESVVVLGGDAREPIVRTVAARVLHALVRPIDRPDGTIHASSSIGVAFFPAHGGTLQGVLRSAARAMYEAKARSVAHAASSVGNACARASQPPVHRRPAVPSGSTWSERSVSERV